MLNEVKNLIAKAKQNVSLTEWSVGDLGNKIDKNITEKVSLKSIKVGDILVIAQTAIYPLAMKQDSEGDIQMTVESIESTDVSVTSKSGEKEVLDILEMRILEAYSMKESDTKIFVVDLPTRVDKKKFESFKKKL